MQFVATVPPLVFAALVRVLRAELRLERHEGTWPRALNGVLRAARDGTLVQYREGKIDAVTAALDLRAFAARCEAEVASWSKESASRKAA
jgi:hypothetical protein